MDVTFELNGRPHAATVDPRVSLADHLIEHGVGVNQGCEEGTCGTCLVRLDGTLVRSCLALAAQADGGRVDTVHSLAPEGELGPVQRAMSQHGGLQCGFCSPAFAMAITDLPDMPVRRALSCVTCRCTGYTGLTAAATRKTGDPTPARREDTRLLTGRGRYVGAITVPGCLHARIVRATRAPARITVEAPAGTVYTAADLPVHELPEGEPILAVDEVRYVGQPIAIAVADTAYLAEDVADQVVVHYEPLPQPTERHTHTAQRVGDLAALDVPDAVTVVATVDISRHTGMPMEPRGLIAIPTGDGLRILGYTKAARGNRDKLAGLLDVDPDTIHVESVDVGGAFGVKGEFYPEDFLVPFVARTLGRPVKWLEDRAEHLVATNHSREQTWTVRMVATPDGRLLGAEAEVVSDIGAYRRPLTGLVPYLATAMFPGPYQMPVFHARITERTTAKTPIGTYRAPGRFEANFARERALDLLAARLDIPPDQLRRRNLLTAAELPYDTGTINEGPVVYDVADFPAAFDHAVALLADTEPAPYRGTAVLPFVEKASLGPTETASVHRINGRVLVEVDSAPSGQGHETVFARVAADALGIPPDRVDVRCGDTANASRGLGTFASRGATMTANAVHRAAGQLRDRPDTDRATATFEFDGHTYPYGAVGIVLDVDPGTWTITVRRLVLVCDAGRVLDENVVRGQLIGGAVQGLGGALFEEMPYDDHGNPQARRLADYLLPLAADVPDVEVVLIGDPCPTTPLGVRGIGEAGIPAIGAVVASAVARALPDIAITALPITPSRLHAAARLLVEATV